MERFILDIEFSGELTKEDLEKVKRNILMGLVRTIDGSGIVPENCEEHTETLYIRHEPKHKDSFDWLGYDLFEGDFV